jgi:hypothetical protein
VAWVILQASELHRGVVRMARSRFTWRALRPVLLAGAATVSWLTLSSTAASADVLPDASSVVGGVTSSVSSVSEKLLSAAPAVPSTPQGGQPAGLLQPVVGSVAGLGDAVVASVPVVQQHVPAGTITAIAAPVARVADGAASAVLEVVVSPVTETVPALDPILEPVSDLVTGTTPLPLPVVLPAVPETADIEDPASVPGSAPAIGTEARNVESPSTGEDLVSKDAHQAAESLSLDAQKEATAPARAGVVVSLVSAFSVVPASAVLADDSGPRTADPSPAPAQVPAAPGSGVGSGASSAGSSGSAAWLSSFDFHLSCSGPVRAGEYSQHAPSPVSFDPGSSPD